MADILLYESPIGYALFKVNQSEEISNSEQFQKSMANYAKFSKYCSLHAFVEFQTSEELLENINAISEGGLHDTLKNFLSENIKKETLGVLDEKLASAINESLKITCTRGKQVGTLVRGVRTHFTQFLLKDVNDGDIRKAMLGLGHSYSRNKVKFNVNKQDTMAVQAIFLLDQLEKDMNTFTMRIKEWYSWHFPELYNILSNDNTKFVKSVLIIQNRNSLDDNKKQQLVEVTDEDTADRIVASANASMGFDVNEFDLQNINTFAKKYLHSKMTTIAPNLTALIGDAVGARLLSKAGSLTNLAKYPASTLQILGAEKALFRAIKTRGNTPKYGVIFASSFIGKADSKNKGRISRFLANKASVASRIDCFGDVQTSRFGEVMKDQVEERLEFLKSGKVPQTNVDVMKTVMEEVAEQRNKDIDEDENESNSSDNSSSEETSGSDSSSGKNGNLY
ncbi:Nucleolar protein 56 [Entamoeba marina]